MRSKPLIVCLFLFVLSLSACASPDVQSTEVSPVPSSTESVFEEEEAELYPLSTPTTIAEVAPIPTSTESVVGKEEAEPYPLSTRTNIAEVDVVLDAVESGDPQALRDLMRFVTIACTTADGLGGPPKCREGEADGTLVEVFPFLGSEGSFLYKAEVSNFPGVSASGVIGAYTVSDSAYAEEAYPAGEYAVIFKCDGYQPYIVMQIRDGIVRIDYHFDFSFMQPITQRDVGEWILTPK